MQPLRSLDDTGEAGISSLYRLHASALLTHLRVNMKSREDAEDLLLEVFIAALEQGSLTKLSQEEQRYWLWRVARNKLVDYYRKSSRRQHVSLDDASETTYPEGEFMPEWVTLRNEEQHSLMAAIHRLPPIQREILLLRYIDGLRSPEIARILGKRDTAIRMILSRTLNLLRQTFETRLGGK